MMRRSHQQIPFLSLLLLVTIATFLVVGCVQVPYEYEEEATPLADPIDLPYLPIVYSVSLRFSSRVDGLRFMDANGQNNTSIETAVISGILGAIRPIFTDEQSQCVFTNTIPPYYFVTIRDGEHIRYHDDFEPVYLDMSKEYSAIYGSPYIMIAKQPWNDDESHLYIVDFDTQTFVTDQAFLNQADRWEYYDLGVNAKRGNYVVYTRIVNDLDYSELVLWEIDNNTEQILGNYDGYIVKDASFSPDGTQIAFYSDHQGIMVADVTADEFTPEVLVAVHHNSGGFYPYFSPQPSWSPDGKWIVYHRQIDPSISEASSSVDNYAIYKLNINTKEEVLLAEGGLHPFWRHDLGSKEE